MRDRKTYIILIIILVVFFVVMFMSFGLDNVKKSRYDNVLLIGNDTTWTYNDKKWFNVRSKSEIEKFSWEKYHVYLNNEKFGDYYLWHDDKWYAFDENKNAVVLDGNLLAYRANYKVDVLNFEQRNITDKTYVNEVLTDIGVSRSSEFTADYMVTLDFDKDGVEEDFYLISNVFPLDFNPETIFSVVFMVKDEKIYYIYNDVSPNKSFNGCKPYFTSFLDTDNDDNYELILSCGKYSTSDSIDMLYKFEDGAFKILISSQ